MPGLHRSFLKVSENGMMIDLILLRSALDVSIKTYIGTQNFAPRFSRKTCFYFINRSCWLPMSSNDCLDGSLRNSLLWREIMGAVAVNSLRQNSELLTIFDQYSAGVNVSIVFHVWRYLQRLIPNCATYLNRNTFPSAAFINLRLRVVYPVLF